MTAIDGRQVRVLVDLTAASLKQIAVIEGDDAAPEAMRPVIDLLQAQNLPISLVYPVVGQPAIDATGTPFPSEARNSIDSSAATLFGATSGPSGAALMYLRWGKNTYANVRPCRYFSGIASPLANPEGIDFTIVRENLEDLYVAIEGELSELDFLDKPGRTTRKPIRELGEGRYAIKAITRQGTERVVQFAFELARKRSKQNKVTCVVKHNMLRESDGFFLEVAKEVAEANSDIEFDHFIVDDFACRMIREPQRFDVIVMPNLYGDVLSDAAGGLLGSLGLAASGCYGDDYAYFEPAHGTAPDIAGKNIINPTATLMTVGMMMEYLGFTEFATRLDHAIEAVYAEGKTLTPDQGGSASTSDMVMAVANAL